MKTASSADQTLAMDGALDGSDAGHASALVSPIRAPIRRGDGRAASSRQTLPLDILTALLLGLDTIVMVAAGLAAALLDYRHPGAGGAGRAFVGALLSAFAALFMLWLTGGWGLGVLRRVARQVNGWVAALLVGAAANAGAFMLLEHATLGSAGRPMLHWLALAGLGLVGTRLLVAAGLRHGLATGLLACKTALVGVNEVGRRFLESVTADPDSAARIVGVYDDRPHDRQAAYPDLATEGSLADLLADSRLRTVDAIVIALPLAELDRVETITRQLSSAVADIYLLADLPGRPLTHPAQASRQAAGRGHPVFGHAPLLPLTRRPIQGWQIVQKAVFDYVFATLLLIFLAPLLLAIAVAIKLDSPGPVFFRQPRQGFNNALFTTYKFRSMYHHMADLLADRQTTRQDRRITRVGKWLRRLSLDELPQLLNVLRGDMSLVGPRPHAPNTKVANRLFADVVAHYADRHRVKPGITGWAQVNGWRGETSTVEQLQNRIACDLDYIENWSIRLDVKITILTVLREIVSKNAF